MNHKVPPIHMVGFVVIGAKNTRKHDDACGSLAMRVEFLDIRGRVVTVMRRPF